MKSVPDPGAQTWKIFRREPHWLTLIYALGAMLLLGEIASALAYLYVPGLTESRSDLPAILFIAGGGLILTGKLAQDARGYRHRRQMRSIEEAPSGL